MSSVRSALSHEQEKQLGSLLGHVRLSLLYKGSIHGYTAVAFHARCDRQGQTVVVAYNKAGFIFGGFTSKDFTQCGEVIADNKAFLFSFREGDGGKSPLRITPKSKDEAFLDSQWGPNFKGLDFLYMCKAAVHSNPGSFYNFEAKEMHGGDLVLTEFEVYRVEDFGGFLEMPWRNVLWSSDLRPSMTAIRSTLSREQEKQLGSLLGHVRLSLLYKGSIHGYTAVAFHARCDRQGPTVLVAYNKAGFVFGAFISKDYTQCGQDVADDKAFLFSFREGDGGKSPLRITPKSKEKAFHDWQWGPNFKRLQFLNRDQALVYSFDGPFYNFKEEEMHGGDLVMTECEVYRVEDVGGLLEKPWRNVLWSSDLRPTMSAVRSALSREQEKQLGSLLGHVRLSLLYKGSVHGYTAVAFHARCDRQGPTVVVAYNKAGFIFGGFTSKDFTQCGQDVADDKAFLFSFRDGDGGKSPLRITPKSKDKAFLDSQWGPNFKGVDFLHQSKAAIQSNPGSFYNFEAKEMHGGDLALTEFEVYRVEEFQTTFLQSFPRRPPRSDLLPTMSAVRSALSREQEKQLTSLLGHVRLSLLYKGSVHGYKAVAFHARCDRQGPTVVVAYNKAGFVFGAFISKDYSQCREVIADDKAFLFSFREGDGGKNPLCITPKSDAQAFTDWQWGPNFKGLDFLYEDQALVYSNPGSFYNFEAKEMHGGDLVLTECEVYRVEDLGGLLEKPWRNVLWSSDLRPTMSSIRSTLSREQEKQLGSLLGHVRLSLLYKGSIHGYTAAAFHARCDQQGPTVVVAYNRAGFIFGGFTSKDYTQRGQVIADNKAFLFSFREGDGGKSPLRITPKSKDEAFLDSQWGPNFKGVDFLYQSKAAIQSNPGTFYNFEAKEMHGGDLVLTEFEVYRVEDFGGLLEMPWRNVLWSSDLRPSMSAVRSALSREQEKQLTSLLGHVRLSLLYKGSVHGYTAVAFHARCDRQGPTVLVAYNKAGFIFGAFISKDYTQCGQDVADDKAFLFSFREGDGGKSPLCITPKSDAQAFHDWQRGPDFKGLHFLHENQALVYSNPGSFYIFEAKEMHGGDLVLTECEVYRVEDVGGLLEKPWRNVLWGSDLLPTMSSVRSALSREQEKQLGSLLGHARLSLLYKASVHSYTAAAFHGRCDLQGPTVVVAYNSAGFVFGAFTSKDYTQRGQVIADDKAFLFSFREGDGGKSPLRIMPKSETQAFTDGNTGPNFGSLVFLNGNQAAVASNPGFLYSFEAAEMHGGDLVLTECEVYRVEEFQTTFLQGFPRRPPRSECSPAGAHDQGGRGVPARGQGSEAGVLQSLHPEEGGGVGPAPGDPHVLHHPGEELQPGAGPGPEQRHPAAHRCPADAEVHRQLLR